MSLAHSIILLAPHRFLESRLVFGMAPDSIVEVLKQRLRWSMGALQILYKTNPLDIVSTTHLLLLTSHHAAAQPRFAACFSCGVLTVPSRPSPPHSLA